MSRNTWLRNTLLRNAAAVSILVVSCAPALAVLGHTTVPNTGPSVYFGSASILSNVGVFSEGGANWIPGFAPEPANTFLGLATHPDGPGLINAPVAIHLGNALTDQVRNDLMLMPLDDNGSGPGDEQSGIPEPATSALLGMAMMGLMFSQSRRSTQRA